MLETMRNQAQSWIAKVILGGIALSFVLWGVGDYFTGSNADPVATINDKPIDSSAFYLSYERQLGAYRAMLGKQFSKELADSLNLKETTLQTLINRQVMLDQAEKLHLAAPESVVLERVHGDPAFQSAGAFDIQRYHVLTRNMGFGSPLDYEQDLRLNIMVDALQKALTSSAYVSESEIHARFAELYEQRVLSAIVVDSGSLIAQVKVDDAAAKAWYESHKADYQSPLRIKVNMVEINPRELAMDIAVDDAEVRAEYEQRQQEFLLPEQRKARHILIRVAADASSSDRAAAKKKIESIQARLKAGEPFDSLAKELSDDQATAVKGGELGWFRKGVMVPAFDQAVFAMSKGEVSGIVESQFGYHLIKLEDVREAHARPFDEVKDEVKQKLVAAKAADEAYKLSQDLDDALGMEDSLKAAADSLNLKMVSSDAVSRDEALAVPLLAESELANKAFSTLPGQPVEIVETGDGRFVAIEVVDRIDPDVLPFAKVVRKVYSDLKQSEANKKAKEIADEILAASDKTMDELAQKYGQAKYISKPIRSSGVGDSAAWLTAAVRDSAFRTAAGQWVDKVLPVAQGYAVVRVKKVIAPDDKSYKKEHDKIAKAVRKRKGEMRFARWLASVRDQYDIVIHEKALQRF